MTYLSNVEDCVGTMCARYCLIFASVDLTEDEVTEIDRVQLKDSDATVLDELLSKYRSDKDGVIVGLEVSG